MSAEVDDDLFATVLHAHPDVLRSLDALREASWATVDPVVLELCRLRVAQLLGCDHELRSRTPRAVAAGLDEAKIAELASWPSSPHFSEWERTCLALCEQFLVDVSGIDDELALAIGDRLGAQGLRDLLTALLVVEQRQRLRLAWERLFERGAA